MEKFIISPDDCLILKAFKDSNSLREAALLLNCDPSGLTRRVQHISSQYGFLHKIENRWQLSSRGLDLVAWTESSIQSQKNFLETSSKLRISTTMWFSETVLMPNLLQLQSIFGPKFNFSLSVPTKKFEQVLMDGSSDFVIACHAPEVPEIEYKNIAKEKWVLVAPKSWGINIKQKKQELLESLMKYPFIRHSEMNLDCFIPELGPIKVSEIEIDNLIGIRSAICEGHGWSLTPKMMIQQSLKEEKLIELPIEIPIHDRRLSVWWLRNRHENKRLSTKISSWLRNIDSI